MQLCCVIIGTTGWAGERDGDPGAQDGGGEICSWRQDQSHQDTVSQGEEGTWRGIWNQDQGNSWPYKKGKNLWLSLNQAFEPLTRNSICIASWQQASVCLAQHTKQIQVENRELRQNLQELIDVTTSLQLQKRRLEKQYSGLLREHQFSQNLQQLRGSVFRGPRTSTDLELGGDEQHTSEIGLPEIKHRLWDYLKDISHQGVKELVILRRITTAIINLRMCICQLALSCQIFCRLYTFSVSVINRIINYYNNDQKKTQSNGSITV